jgi:AraC-like DNA-binding protein
MTETVNIQNLARELHLSVPYLQRLFKRQTGVSLSKLLNEQRLERAAALLADHGRSVKEIAYTVGYKHVSSFIRAFEHRFSKSPGRYREAPGQERHLMETGDGDGTFSDVCLFPSSNEPLTPPPQPFNPQFSPFPAFQLACRHFHAILSRVRRTSSPPVRLSRALKFHLFLPFPTF